MASSTRHGGPSYTPDELADPDLPAVIVKRAELGYVDRKEKEGKSSQKTDGGDSTQSSEKQATHTNSPEKADPKPARMTANRSKARKTEDSTAHSTDGSTRKTGTESAEAEDEFDDFDEFA